MPKVLDVARAQARLDLARQKLQAAQINADGRPKGDSDWDRVDAAQVEYSAAQSALKDAKFDADLKESNARAMKARAERESAEAERVANLPKPKPVPGKLAATFETAAGDVRVPAAKSAGEKGKADQSRTATAKKQPATKGKKKPPGKGGPYGKGGKGGKIPTP